MPTYRAPFNDMDRLTFLRRAAATGRADMAAGNLYLRQQTIDEVEALVGELEAALRNMRVQRTRRSAQVRQRNEAARELAVYVRDFWQTVRRRARRLRQPPEVLIFYGLPLDGRLPNPRRPDELLTIAANVVRGDAHAVAAGFPAMSNPSAEELTAVLTIAEAAAAEAAAADRAYDQSQESVAACRAQADRLITDVMAELRFMLRRLDAPSQRRIMRTYGASFAYLRDESPDADDVPDLLIDKPPAPPL
ncbi:MAG: hypothetical protein KC441_13970 [Anaerolineales bacterium]|nr:hypothetical protein [Anaerolineales bacterium]